MCIRDSIVVWQDDRNGHWDIYGFNLETGQEFRITDSPADEMNPAISGNLVVWEDSRSGVSEIYAAFLKGREVARCPVWPEGDFNGDCVVDMKDFAAAAEAGELSIAELGVMADGWLECGLVPASVCPQ